MLAAPFTRSPAYTKSHVLGDRHEWEHGDRGLRREAPSFEEAARARLVSEQTNDPDQNDQPPTDEARIEAGRRRLAYSNGNPLPLLDPDEAWDLLRHIEDAS